MVVHVRVIRVTSGGGRSERNHINEPTTKDRENLWDDTVVGPWSTFCAHERSRTHEVNDTT